MQDTKKPRSGFASLAHVGEEGEFSIIDAIGGVRGVVESMLPGLVFVVVFVVVGDVRVTVAISAALAVVQVVARLIQRQSLAGALGGLVSVAICLVWAWTGNDARDYYLFGFITNAVYVQVPLYVTNHVTALGTARLVMGIPFWALAIWVSYLIVATPMHRHAAARAAQG